MKVQPRSFARFASRIEPTLRAVLIYGPDGGLVRERAVSVVRAVVGDPRDPFRVAELPMAAIAEAPGRLAEEAAALALTGGRRVVRVLNATDRLTESVSRLLGDATGEALIVIETGELGPRSSLRRLCEEAADAAAVPCYADDEESLEVLIGQVAREAKLEVEPAALEYLKANLGGDRGVTRGELEKLVLYVGPGQGAIRLADAEICVGDSSALGVDDVVDAAAAGDFSALERALNRSLQAGESPIALVRATQRHLQRLHLVAGICAGGQPLDAAMKRLRPPPHFSRQATFRAQLRQWPVGRLAQALDLLTETEIECKSTGAPDQVLVRSALARIAGAARASGG